MKRLSFVTAFLFFTACSKVGVGYTIGTGQVRNKVDDAFGFSGKKGDQVDQFLSDEFDKNKKEFFKRLKTLIINIKALAKKPTVSKADSDNLMLEAQSFQKDMIELFKPSFNKVFHEVGDSEIKVFKEYSDDQISEKEEDASDKKKFKKKKMKTFVRVAEFLLDNLTSEQEKLVEKFLDEHIDYYINQIQIRKKFNEDLIRLYPAKDKMIDLSLAYYSGDQSIRTDDYKKQRESFELEMKNFILSLWKLSTSEQKNFFQQRTDEMLKEIEKVL